MGGWWVEQGVVGVSTLAIEKERKKGFGVGFHIRVTLANIFSPLMAKPTSTEWNAKHIPSCANVIIHSLLQMEYLKGKS